MQEKRQKKNIGGIIDKKYFTKEELQAHDRELVRQVGEKIIKFINELAWKDVQYDAFQSTIGEFCGSTSAIPRYAKKYFDLWKEMFGEDLENKG